MECDPISNPADFLVPGHPAQKSAFFPHLVTWPPLYFFLIMDLRKKKNFFCLRYEHMYLENIPLK